MSRSLPRCIVASAGSMLPIVLVGCTPESACTGPDCEGTPPVDPFTHCAVEGDIATLVSVPRNTALPSALGLRDHALVTYEDVAPDGSESKVGLVWVDSDLVTDAPAPVYTGPELSSNPVLVPASDGVVVVWSFQEGLVGARLDADGTVLAGPFDLGDGYAHEVAAREDGFVVAWTPNGGGPGGIGAFSADGARLGSAAIDPIETIDGITVIEGETWLFGFGAEAGMTVARFDPDLVLIDSFVIADDTLRMAHSSTVIDASVVGGEVQLTAVVEAEIGDYALIRGHLLATGGLSDVSVWNPEEGSFYSATARNDGRARVTAWSNDEDEMSLRAAVEALDGTELLPATDLSVADILPRIEPSIAAVDDGYLVVWRFFDLGANALEARHIACE